MAMQGNAARYSEKRGSQALFMPCRIKPGVLKCKVVVALLIAHVSRSLLVFPHGIAIGVAVVDLNDNIAQRYAAIVVSLKQQGTPIPTNDIWIAAAAFKNGGRIIAYDHHFEAVAGLMVEAP